MFRIHLSACFLALALVGCGSNQLDLRGDVSYDGTPVDRGSIAFLPEPGTQSRKAAAAIKDGKYEIPADRGPSPGKFRVQITWTKKTGKTAASADPGMTIDETHEAMPAKYNTESTLIRDVSAETKTLDFHLPR